MMPLTRMVIAGVGLIGGSLSLALRRAGLVEEVVGWGRDRARLAAAAAAGVIDRGETEPTRALPGAEMLVLGVPLGATAAVLREAAPHLDADAIVTDVGSVKGSVVRDAEAVFGRLPPRFVPGHPIAGTEQRGFEAAFAELFQGHRVILTPAPDTDGAALSRVRAMWAACAGEVIEMPVTHHDRMLAAVSHLPHLLAYGLVDTLGRWDGHEEVFQYAAGGFRDFTRIASSDPVMWRDICLANRGALSEALRSYRDDLERLIELVDSGDGDGLAAVFEQAKATRARYRYVFEH